MSERLLFVTGRLAEPALRDTLSRAELPFDYDVAVMKITVAALMTTDWIARFLHVPDGVTRIMIPGMCEGDVDVLSERFGVPAENLTTQGYGEQYLKIATEAPEQENRRVTVRRITPLLASAEQ